jgi:hypothetical protein
VSYEVTARGNAAGISGEAKILAISGVIGEEAQSASQLDPGTSESESDTPGKAGGLMSGAASKAVAPSINVCANH